MIIVHLAERFKALVLGTSSKEREFNSLNEQKFWRRNNIYVSIYLSIYLSINLEYASCIVLLKMQQGSKDFPEQGLPFALILESLHIKLYVLDQ
jgi:hypothetical protein